MGSLIKINTNLYHRLSHESETMHKIYHNTHGPDHSPKATTPSDNINFIATTAVAPAVAVFLLSSIIFFTVGALCVKLFQSKTVNDQSEESTKVTSPATQGQNMVPIYETIHESVVNAYDLNENVAYGCVLVRQQ